MSAQCCEPARSRALAACCENGRDRYIEAEVREEIAREIEAEHVDCLGVALDGYTAFACFHLEDAHIARMGGGQ